MRNILQKLNLFTILIALLTFTLGWQLGHRDVNVEWKNYQPSIKVENKEPPKEIGVDFKLFWDTWDLVSKKYRDKTAIDSEKMFYGAIQGMVASLGDPYTVFLPPEAQKSTKEELGGSFSGVGIELGFDKDKRLSVVAPLEGTPADRAGIKPEDVIVKIEEKDTLNLSLPEAVSLIRGPKGSPIALTIFTPGDSEPREIKLIRDTIIVKSVTVKFENVNNRQVAVIKLARFGEKTQEEWNEAVSKVLAAAPVGVILDLRNDPGGFLDGAVYVASEFLDGGEVLIQESGDGSRYTYKVNRQGKLLKLPLVVLINKGSASASEIVAGALQDRKRAKLVGTKSFGKGTVQETEDLPGGTGIHITTARWLTPLSRWVNDTTGLIPDVLIEMPKTEATSSAKPEDVQLKKALELL